MEKVTYSVVVESGVCSADGKSWEEKVNCGHKHESIESAKRCIKKLTRSFCNEGHVSSAACQQCVAYAQPQNTSSMWYGARIHNQKGERVEA